MLHLKIRRVNRKKKGSKNRRKAATKVGKLHKKISDKRQAYQWYIANKITTKKADAIGLEDLNVAGMLRRCQVKVDEKTGRFVKNGQSRKKALNRSISDAVWTELTLKIEHLAAKQYKVVVKVNPRSSSQECRNCGHTDKLNRDKERFICTNFGQIDHADLGAAKTVRDRTIEAIQSMVHGDSVKPEPRGSKRPKHRKEISARPLGKPVEPGKSEQSGYQGSDVLRITVPFRAVSVNERLTVQWH